MRVSRLFTGAVAVAAVCFLSAVSRGCGAGGTDPEAGKREGCENTGTGNCRERRHDPAAKTIAVHR